MIGHSWRDVLAEAAALALDALRTERARSVLAIAGIVIGIVTVVLVASVLANVRNQVALLFRDLGTDNVFAFHLTGDPYVTPNEKEARRRLCANCEYFQNDPMFQAKMEAIPLDKFDMDGGGRGYCEKFDFICHNLRACQAWEEDD